MTIINGGKIDDRNRLMGGILTTMIIRLKFPRPMNQLNAAVIASLMFNCERTSTVR